MKSVYFDTNVYSHILNRQYGITEADVTKLFAKLREAKLRVFLSDAVLEETIGAFLNREREGIRRLEILRKIANRKRMLKTHIAILDDNLLSYAKGVPVPSSFRASGNLKAMLKNQTPIGLKALRMLGHATQGGIDEQHERYEKMINGLRPEAKEEIRLRKRPTLEHYLDDYSILTMEKFAELAGVLPECQQRGIEGLLKLRPLKAVAVAIWSQWYTNVYDRQRTSRGDSRDLQHVVLGAAVGTLVTHDTRFSKALRQIPIEGFEITDLHTLLAQL